MTSLIVLLFGVLPLVQAPPPARVSDEEVKALLERIDNERDRFEDQLDGEVKRSIIRNQSGEFNVERYLDDLQENVKNMRERYKPEYAAGNEVAIVLRQGAEIQRGMSQRPPNFKGASEWNQLSSSLGQLAAVYGNTFPITDGTPVRRISDTEVIEAAAQTEAAADKFRKQLDSALKMDKTFSLANRQAAVQEADSLKRDAKALRERVKDGKPSSGEATQLVERAARIQEAGAKLPLTPAAKTAWSGVVKPLTTIAHGFNIPAIR